MSTENKEVQTSPSKTASTSQATQVTPSLGLRSRPCTSAGLSGGLSDNLSGSFSGGASGDAAVSQPDFNLRLSDEEDNEDGRDEEVVKKGRKKLTDGERQELRKTFDPLNVDTILVTDIEKALEQSQEFSALFQRIKQREMLDDRNTNKLIQSSYRSMKRNARKKKT